MLKIRDPRFLSGFFNLNQRERAHQPTPLKTHLLVACSIPSSSASCLNRVNKRLFLAVYLPLSLGLPVLSRGCIVVARGLIFAHRSA